MSRYTDPFYSAKLLAHLARADVEDFATGCQTFIDNCQLEFIADYNQEADQTIVRARVRTDIPDELERDAVRLVMEMRATLDKAVNAAAKVITNSGDVRYTSFPFGTCKAEVEGQLRAERGQLRNIPKELHEHLLGLAPHMGGNDLLAAFGVFSNPAKHEAVLAVNLRLLGIGINSGNWHFDRVQIIWNEAKDEAELFRLRGRLKSYNGLRISCGVAFHDAKGLTDKEVSSTLCEIAGMVETIVLGLEAETARIVAERG